MNIYEKMGDTIIVYMPREVDDYAAVKMTAGIDGVFAEEVVRHAIFDFGRTTFMDSSGIGLITRRYRQLHDRGGSVGVINVNARMDRILLMFLEDLGIEKSGLDRLIQCSYDLLGLISFLTYGKDECRAWTIRKGTKAPQAAGKIHSDIERGCIRAETINFDEMMACGGSVGAAKEKGLLRSEGKDYVVKDCDMIYFRFNV